MVGARLFNTLKGPLPVHRNVHPLSLSFPVGSNSMGMRGVNGATFRCIPEMVKNGLCGAVEHGVRQFF